MATKNSWNRFKKLKLTERGWKELKKQFFSEESQKVEISINKAEKIIKWSGIILKSCWIAGNVMFSRKKLKGAEKVEKEQKSWHYLKESQKVELGKKIEIQYC